MSSSYNFSIYLFSLTYYQHKSKDNKAQKQDKKALEQIFSQRIILRQQRIMERAIKNYDLLQKVGEGQYGNVYKAQDRKSKVLYAVKVMAVQKFKSLPKLTQLTNNEMAILSKINHPNIIKFIQMEQTNSHYYLVYQFCNGGTLQEKIKTQKMINENDAVAYFKQLVSAFQQLFGRQIIHRDIKPTNILFHNGKLKLADFGFCKELANSAMAQTMIGSPIYMAPEVLKNQVYDSRADIWSLGVVLYEMLYGRCPYEDNSIPKIITMISNTMLTFPKFPRVCQPLRVFIKRMLTIKASQRISQQQFIKYPLQLALQQKQQVVQMKVDYQYAIKFTRNNIAYIIETLVVLAPVVNQLQNLRMAFLTYKVIRNVWRLTRKSGVYWQEIGQSNNQSKWDQYYQQEIQALAPYGDIVRDTIKKCDASLKIKLELQKDTIDTRYFIECVREIQPARTQLRNRLINCLLINIHYIRVLDKKKPDWQDYTTLQKEYQQKEDSCLNYARYN